MSLKQRLRAYGQLSQIHSNISLKVFDLRGNDIPLGIEAVFIVPYINGGEENRIKVVNGRVEPFVQTSNLLFPDRIKAVMRYNEQEDFPVSGYHDRHQVIDKYLELSYRPGEDPTSVVLAEGPNYVTPDVTLTIAIDSYARAYVRQNKGVLRHKKAWALKSTGVGENYSRESIMNLLKRKVDPATIYFGRTPPEVRKHDRYYDFAHTAMRTPTIVPVHFQGT